MSFQPHLDLAHRYWRELIIPGDHVIDATCGNGQDTLILASLTTSSGKVWAIDLQKTAIDNTQKLLQNNLGEDQFPQVEFYHGCHRQFPKAILEESMKLIVYNLGYLPGGDKSKTTIASETLASVQAAQGYLLSGGVISITCYPGHAEGAKEEALLLEYCQQLSPSLWNCCYHRWINRQKSPSLLLLKKRH